MRIIVHFGMPKTGSTSIQRTLYKNSKQLNICYPSFKAIHNEVLYAAFHERPNHGLPETHKQQALLKLKTELELNLAKNRDVLLSAEILTTFRLSELKAFYSVLSNYSKDIIAVGYIRSPKAYIESFFQQNAKNPRKMRVLSFKLGKRFPHYQTLFEKFDQVFGKENTHFWKFDPASFPNGCVVSDFCQRLNINVAPKAIERVNEGLSLEAVSLLYAYSRHEKELRLASPPATNEDIHLMISLLSQRQGKKLRFASNLIKPILEANHSQVKWMEARMGASLAEDICKDDDNAIHSRAELLTFAPETTHWLAKQLGTKYVRRWRPRMNVKHIAAWLHLLLLKLAKEKQAKKLSPNQAEKKAPAITKPILVKKKALPDLTNLSTENVDLLVSEIFKQILKEIETSETGVVDVVGFGVFKIQHISIEEQKIASKRILFEPQKDGLILPQ